MVPTPRSQTFSAQAIIDDRERFLWGSVKVARNGALTLLLLIALSASQASSGSIPIPLDSIKGKWVYVGVVANASPKPLPRNWPFDTFEIKKSKNGKAAKKFHNIHVVKMSRIGYFANSFLSPINNGKPIDSMTLYHDNTNSCGEHAVQYYGNRIKGDLLLRRLVLDTMHLSFTSSHCKNGKSAVDSSSLVYIKLKPRIGGKRIE